MAFLSLVSFLTEGFTGSSFLSLRRKSWKKSVFFSARGAADECINYFKLHAALVAWTDKHSPVQLTSYGDCLRPLRRTQKKSCERTAACGAILALQRCTLTAACERQPGVHKQAITLWVLTSHDKAEDLFPYATAVLAVYQLFILSKERSSRKAGITGVLGKNIERNSF